METPFSNREHSAFERARLSRDARFDGQFYIGVLTTGIYCRPVCPANPPRRDNVRFFPSAAAASEAGFRPCLRCRPECAPGSPAWAGTSTTVRRGLRLIASGALEQGSVDQLAAKLGVTGRHLRRLFVRHVGASPLAVAHTQRLHFAKRLIDDTALPFSHIAAASGFGSTRRFNDTFTKVYGRTPRELRRRTKDTPREAATDDGFSVSLSFRQPFDWPTLLGFFRHRALSGVESVSDDCYRRSIWLEDSTATICLGPDPKPGHLRLTLHGVSTALLLPVIQRSRELLDLDAPVGMIADVLQRDDMLAPLIAAQAGVRVPGAWDGFELAVRAVLGQQVSVKAATTIAARIVARYGEPLPAPTGGLTHSFPDAKRLRRARFNDIGLTRSRAATLRALAAAVVAGDVSFDPCQEPAEFRGRIQAIRGIGEWTAHYVSMRAMKDPDAFPASDLGLLTAIDPERRIRPQELRQRAEAWRPWRAYAALLLWNSLAGSGG